MPWQRWRNQQEATPIPLVASLFRIEMDDGVVYTGAGFAGTACANESVSLAQGGKRTCKLVFG